MSRANLFFIYTILIGLFLCCKPYNSDEANHKLIQGKWMLVDVVREDLDTIKVDYSKQLTYLIFEGNKCSQLMVDLDDISDYSFSIRNFQLDLYSGSFLSNSLYINMLTADSLILGKGSDYVWKYKRIEQ